ncbi:ATP-binding protein [Pantanalinema sp. GBBB05]|uniref:ATP-binding protein n=1 Tax=Pantanalinema sp. GBBB05 TaxID=2604139 RepID=UPI001DE3F0B4|nr:response regulator [Pantanalinema sp. GBBB05]
MSQHTTCLSELIELIPTCSATATLAMVLAEFSQMEINRLVVIDAQHYPIGIVSLPTLMSYVLTIGLEHSVPRIPANAPILATPLLELEPSIVESVLVLPADLTLEQLLGHLQLADSAPYAFVDRQGCYLGLLNQIQLLRVLTAELLTTNLTPPDPFLPLTGQITQLIQDRHQPQRQPIVSLMQQLLTQKQELEQQIQIQQQIIHHLQVNHASLSPTSGTDLLSTPTEAQASTALLELLDRLPLPLMLQTSQGRVVIQNMLWQEQVGGLLEPDCVGRDAAQVLETAELELATSNRSLEPEFNQPDRTAIADPVLTNAPLCYIGTKPNTCICVCALKDGQERIWQFIKIPLGAVLPHPLVDSSNQTNRLEDHRTAEPAGQSSFSFRLANLISTPSTDVDELSTHGTVPLTETLWLILAQDVTEQQQLARELTAKNADLVQLNRLKDEFLACISHELKTPLTAVLGLSSLLKDQTLGALNQRQIHYAQLIYQSGRHLMTVVNDILDLTRIETGQLDLVFEPVNIPSVCSRAFDQAKQLWLVESKQDIAADDCPIAQFSLEIEPGLETIVADELRLRQILVHLLSNALKFTEPDNPIGLKIGYWGGWIACTVWDTGMGIPADKQHLIFQKFQQLENPLTRRFEGTGLGLVLTQRLARLHGGDVTFLSKEGQGSQFTVLLPPTPAQPNRSSRVANSEDFNDSQLSPLSPSRRVPLHTLAPTTLSQMSFADPLSPSGSRAISSSNRLVLIVEASPPSIEALSDQLTGLGYRVVIARSGTEALEKARRLQPCIIFLNPLLPLLSGWDVLTLLKSNLETRQIPVVVTATTADEEEARHSHANGFLSMPIAPKALQTVLQQFITEPIAPKSRTTTTKLTILRLSPPLLDEANSSSWHHSTLDLNQLLHSHHYRVLEADDLEQAELLARVWKPDVVLLDQAVPNPDVYFQQYSHHTFLASLPLVMLDPTTAQAANQIPGLIVFPCLAAPDTKPFADGDPEASALLRVVQIAAGYIWRPVVLAIDLATLPISIETTSLPTSVPPTLGSPPQETEWLQALMQYLQTAGFSGSIARSWQEVLYQVQSQSIDLLLIGCTTPKLPGTVVEQLVALHHLTAKPPVLVLDHRYSHLSDRPRIATDLPEVIQQLATQILPYSTSMTDLLHHIQQVVNT